jgi:hypothetical protein
VRLLSVATAAESITVRGGRRRRRRWRRRGRASVPTRPGRGSLGRRVGVGAAVVAGLMLAGAVGGWIAGRVASRHSGDLARPLPAGAWPAADVPA